MSRIQANLLLLLAACIWGGGFVAQSTAMDTITPLWFVGIRFGIAALAVLPLAMMEATKLGGRPARRDFKGFIFVGLALVAGSSTQQVGLLTTSVTNSSFLTGLYVIFVPVISVLIYRRNPHPIVWPGAFMMLLGIFMLSGGSFTQLKTGDILCIICAFCWAIQITLAGQFVASSNRPLALSCTQFATCSIVAMSLAAIFEPISIAAITGAYKEILYVGLISSGLAFVLQVVAQRYTTPSQTAIFLSSEALFGAFFAATFLSETIPAIGYIGCALIFCAILLVELVPEVAKKRSLTATQP